MVVVVNATSRPLYPQVRDLVPSVKDVGLDPGTVWSREENFAPKGIRYPVSPARSKSLFRLSYPGPRKLIILLDNKNDIVTFQ
jgi:hypothetical protein